MSGDEPTTRTSEEPVESGALEDEEAEDLEETNDQGEPADEAAQ